MKDITFTLGKGEFLFLSGPSGAGKSTLLKLLYSGLPLQRGDVWIAGFSLNSLKNSQIPLLRRQVSVVFQDFKIMPNRSVRDNIALPLEIRGLAPLHIERRVKAVAKALKIEEKLKNCCGSLSGGEQQRVAVARSFVVNPQVLLADEPTGNLDPDLSLRLMDLFMQFQSYGTTVIFATHSHELLKRHPSARLMRIEQGMVTYASWPGALLYRRADMDMGGVT